MNLEELEHSVKLSIRQYTAGLNEVWKTIGLVKNSEMAEADRRRLLQRLYSPLSQKDIKNTFAHDVTEMGIGISFRSSVSHTRHWKEALGRDGWIISPGGNSKKEDHAFAQALNVPTPKVMGSSLYLDDLELQPGTVIKPESGAAASGVFWVDSERNLFSFATKRKYRSLDEAKVELKGKKALAEPVWKIEQLIEKEPGVPAHDYKVWMFYGEVGVIQEVRRNPQVEGPYSFFYHRPDGSEFKINGTRKKLESDGVPNGVIDAATKISLASPVPYLRVDFLANESEFYLGEITPHPGGNYAGEMFDAADKELGSLYINAEARLFADLLDGKSFDEFFAVYSTNNKPSSGRV